MSSYHSNKELAVYGGLPKISKYGSILQILVREGGGENTLGLRLPKIWAISLAFCMTSSSLKFVNPPLFSVVHDVVNTGILKLMDAYSGVM